MMTDAGLQGGPKS